MAYGFTYTLPTITGSHTDFPVLLREDDFPSAAIDGGASSILNGGGNLRAYTSSAKTTRLPVEVVSFVSGATPAAEVWVTIPTAATGNTIYIEADDTETTQPAVTNAYGRNAVWSDYEAVYHLEEAANTDPDGYLDSTGNGNDGTGSAAWLTDTPGQIGNAAQNDGGSNYIDCPTTAVSTIKRLSSWMQFDSLSGNRTFGSHDGTNRLYLGTTGSNLFVGYGSGYTNSVSGGFGAGTPVKLSLAVDGSTVRVRVNGVEKTTFSASASGASTKNLYLLGRNYTDLIDKIDGWQDEVLLDTVYRSADWEATEYANQSASGAWGTVGTWADSGGSDVTGTLSATESGSDSLASTGAVFVDGSLAATEAGVDSASASGDVLVQGVAAATESGFDVFAATGAQIVAGTLAGTEAGDDTLASTGSVLVAGTAAATESGADTLSVAGSVLVHGSAAAVESGADTFTASGASLSAGDLAAVESGQDTVSSTGQVVVSGAVAATESGIDSLIASGDISVSGDLSAAESGVDSAAVSGGVLVSGSIATSETGQDSFSAHETVSTAATKYSLTVVVPRTTITAVELSTPITASSPRTAIVAVIPSNEIQAIA